MAAAQPSSFSARIPAAEFNSAAHQSFLRNSLQLLVRRPGFLSYDAHRAYLMQLQYTWFVAPSLLFVAIYVDVVSGLLYGKVNPLEFAGTSVAALSSVVCVAVALTGLLLLGLGSSVVCGFCGCFVEYLPATRVWAFAVSAVTMQLAATVVCGVRRTDMVAWLTWCDLPTGALLRASGALVSDASWDSLPFANPLDVERLSLNTLFVTKLPAGAIASLALNVALPLLGPFAFGWGIYAQRQVFWQRASHWPMPLLSIPVCCLLFSAAWALTVQVAVTEVASAVSQGDALQLWPLTQTVCFAVLDHIARACTNASDAAMCLVRCVVSPNADASRSVGACVARAITTPRLIQLWRGSLFLGLVYYCAAVFARLLDFMLSLVARGTEALLWDLCASSSRLVRLVVYGGMAVAVLAGVLAADLAGDGFWGLTPAMAGGALGAAVVLVTLALTDLDDDA